MFPKQRQDLVLIDVDSSKDKSQWVLKSSAQSSLGCESAMSVVSLG